MNTPRLLAVFGVSVLAITFASQARAGEGSKSIQPVEWATAEEDHWAEHNSYWGFSLGVPSGNTWGQSFDSDHLTATEGGALTGCYGSWIHPHSTGVAFPEWMRLRVEANLGCNYLNMDNGEDGLGVDRLKGDAWMLRGGADACVDFRLPQTSVAVGVGLGAGLATTKYQCTRMASGGITESSGWATSPYFSVPLSVSIGVCPKTEVVLTCRNMFLNDMEMSAGSRKARMDYVGSFELGFRRNF